MKLTIDNLQGQGTADYTAALDGTVAPRVERKINQPAELQLQSGGEFARDLWFRRSGARVILAQDERERCFYRVSDRRRRSSSIWDGASKGPVYRYDLIAESDEVLLDQKALPNRAPFVERSAGSGAAATGAGFAAGMVRHECGAGCGYAGCVSVNPQKNFSYHAAEIALAARASYRAMNGALLLAPVGAATYAINESDANFSPMGLKLVCPKTAGE